MKRVLGLLLIVSLLLTMAIPATAAAPDQVTPRFTYIASFSRSISFNPSTNMATCQGNITASSLRSVGVECKLQVYWAGEWSTLETWTASSLASVTIQETYPVVPNFNYRVHVTGYVYDDNGNVLEEFSGTHEQYFRKL